MIDLMLARYSKARGRERGVVLIAVLMFIAVLLPVTLLILDSVRIESLLPVNEAYTRTAGDEADKGFDEAMAAIMADQDPYAVDVSRDLTDPVQAPNYWHDMIPAGASAKHQIDYLAQQWARHPDNDTVFLVERSLENVANIENPDAGADPDVHSVPARWQLMNVPFGMDDFGEYYNDGGDYPRLFLPFEYVGYNVVSTAPNAPAFYVDPSTISMMAGAQGGYPVADFCYQDRDYWQLPPSDPNFYVDISRLASVIQFRPRPASYFRNTSGEPSTGLGSAVLPTAEGDFTGSAGFIRENNSAIDRLVYQGRYDYSLGANQYPFYLPLQQAVTESAWANPFFGSTSSSSVLAAAFTTSNKEYKPAPGSIDKYQLGAQEGEAVPGWHEAIVSDESGRFPINQILNVIFSSANTDYNEYGTDRPAVRRDYFDISVNADLNVLNDDTHPNYSGFLMAREMLISLLMTDEDMARMANSWDQGIWDGYTAKATWMIRQMLARRRLLDESTDFDRDGDYSDDESSGERFQFPELMFNNNSDTIPGPPNDSTLDGSGKMGDGEDLWDGTWRAYTNPKDMLTDFIGTENPPNPGIRISARDFELLNQRVTLYSMDTEHAADPDHETVSGAATRDLRYNINRMAPRDDAGTAENEAALYDFLLPKIGRARLDSILNWREGLVDLNGDGDLNDEFIEQPVASQRYDEASNSYQDVGSWPVSTVTYRERNNPDFQDPLLPAAYIDPDYLNIRNLGDLLTIPMSAAKSVIAYSEAANAAVDPEVIVKDLSGNILGGPLGSRSLYPDFTNVGTGIAYDDCDDSTSEIFQNDLALANQTSVVNNRRHPSWGPADQLMAYYNGDNLYVHDIVSGGENTVLTNADLPPEVDSTTVDFWDHWTTSLIGNAVFEMASPDISPNGTNNEIAYSKVSESSNGEDFLDPDVAYNIASIKTDGTVPDLITDNDHGTYDYAPDYSSSGDFIVFTRTTYDYSVFVSIFVQRIVEPIPITSIWLADRAGTFAIPLQAFWDVRMPPFTTDPGMIDIDSSNAPIVTVTIHQPMFPSFSPDDQTIAFMDCPITFWVNTDDPEPLQINPVNPNPVNADIYTMPLDFIQDWSAMVKDPNASVASAFEIFPDLGRGSIMPAEQGDSQIGDVQGAVINMANASTTTHDTTVDPFTDTDRQLIAMDLGRASLALRRSIGWGADDQNWRLEDLPAVPEHVASVLKEIADVVCFRDATVTYDPRYPPPDPNVFPPPVVPDAPLQAYPGKVNINTASREVLRTVFLNMFQGPLDDPDDEGQPNNSPAPRYRSGGSFRYINLLDPAATDFDRFMALMVADRYAKQVVEYRKWIYDNQGTLGVTDETVPSNLPLYEAANPTASHYGNYRANPFYPLVDTNGDGTAPDVPLYDPEPPFRSVADLFNVMLYDNDAFTTDWTYEGIGGSGGPEPVYLPRPVDEDGNVVGPSSTNELSVWGPIYNTDQQRMCTHPAGSLGNGTLFGFATTVDNNFSDAANYNKFYEYQSFRLFSADDFRRIAPFLTVRTYNYRIESRGVVRVASGANRTDITRDKIWIITTNTDANFGERLSTTWDYTQPLDFSFLAENRGDGQYFTVYFEETPQSGLALTRGSFLPE